MSSIIQAPTELLEACAEVRFPPKTDALMQPLMDRNNNGLLTADELVELEALVELSESRSLIRAKAIRVLRTS